MENDQREMINGERNTRKASFAIRPLTLSLSPAYRGEWTRLHFACAVGAVAGWLCGVDGCVAAPAVPVGSSSLRSSCIFWAYRAPPTFELTEYIGRTVARAAFSRA